MRPRAGGSEWFTTEGSYKGFIQHDIVPYGIEDPRADEEDLFPRARFEIKLQRRWGFYVLRVLLPLFLITALSWATCWMPASDLSDRLGIS